MIENKLKNKSQLWSIRNFNLKLDDKMEEIGREILTYIEQNKFIEKKSIILKKNGINDSEFYSVLHYLESEKKIIKLSSDLFYSINILDKIKVDLKAHFKKSNSLTISQFKEISNTTRKLAVPLLEYLDKINFTFRVGNSRELTGSVNE